MRTTSNKKNRGQQSLTTDPVCATLAYVARQDPEFLDARGVQERFNIRRSLLYELHYGGHIKSASLRRRGQSRGPGILNWCIAGLDMVLRDIDASSNGDIQLTDRQRQIVDSLLAESDSLRFFLRDHIERAEGADSFRQRDCRSVRRLLPRNGLEGDADQGGP